MFNFQGTPPSLSRRQLCYITISNIPLSTPFLKKFSKFFKPQSLAASWIFFLYILCLRLSHQRRRGRFVGMYAETLPVVIVLTKLTCFRLLDERDGNARKKTAEILCFHRPSAGRFFLHGKHLPIIFISTPGGGGSGIGNFERLFSRYQHDRPSHRKRTISTFPSGVNPTPSISSSRR